MSPNGMWNDYLSMPYATREAAHDALMHYVDTDLEDGAVDWEQASDDRYVDPDGEATVEVRVCDEPCEIGSW
jgi:hypothetical protein